VSSGGKTSEAAGNGISETNVKEACTRLVDGHNFERYQSLCQADSVLCPKGAMDILFRAMAIATLPPALGSHGPVLRLT
jgi:hypothetical protein